MWRNEILFYVGVMTFDVSSLSMDLCLLYENFQHKGKRKWRESFCITWYGSGYSRGFHNIIINMGSYFIRVNVLKQLLLRVIKH